MLIEIVRSMQCMVSASYLCFIQRYYASPLDIKVLTLDDYSRSVCTRRCSFGGFVEKLLSRVLLCMLGARPVHDRAKKYGLQNVHYLDATVLKLTSVLANVFLQRAHRSEGYGYIHGRLYSGASETSPSEESNLTTPAGY